MLTVYIAHVVMFLVESLASPEKYNIGIREGSIIYRNNVRIIYLPITGPKTFTCFANHTNPAARLAWHRNGQLVKGLKMTSSKDSKGMWDSALTVTLTYETVITNDVYSCKIMHVIEPKVQYLSISFIVEGPFVVIYMEDVVARPFTPARFIGTFKSVYEIRLIIWAEMRYGRFQKIVSIQCSATASSRGSEGRVALFSTDSAPFCYNGTVNLTIPYADPKNEGFPQILELRSKKNKSFRKSAVFTINYDEAALCRIKDFVNLQCQCDFTERRNLDYIIYFTKSDGQTVECDHKEVKPIFGNALYRYVCRSAIDMGEVYQFHVVGDKGEKLEYSAICDTHRTTERVSTEPSDITPDVAIITDLPPEKSDPNQQRTEIIASIVGGIWTIVFLLYGGALIIRIARDISKEREKHHVHFDNKKRKTKTVTKNCMRELLYRIFYHKRSTKQKSQKIFTKKVKSKSLAL